MPIASAELHEVRLPLRQPYEHRSARFVTSESVVLVLRDRDGLHGIGECAPRGYVTGETVGSVVRDVEALFGAVLRGRRADSVAEIGEVMADADRRLSPGPGGNATRGMIEGALLDRLARQRGVTVAELLGWPIDGALTPILPVGLSGSGTDRALELARRFGLRDVKLRVGAELGPVADRIGQLRAVLGHDIRIGVDANGGFTPDVVRERAARLADLGVAYLEQPLAVGLEAELARLRPSLGIAVSLDESLRSLEDVEARHRDGSCDLFNVKVGKVGGLLRAGAILGYLDAHRLPCIVSLHVGETAILETCGVLAALRSRTLFQFEGGYAAFVLETTLASSPTSIGRDGRVRYQPAGPGLGPAIALDHLARHAARTLHLSGAAS